MTPYQQDKKRRNTHRKVFREHAKRMDLLNPGDRGTGEQAVAFDYVRSILRRFGGGDDPDQIDWEKAWKQAKKLPLDKDGYTLHLASRLVYQGKTGDWG